MTGRAPRAVRVLVVGGGHAGIEAALAARRLGADATVVTCRRSGIGELSCNPSIGGIAKGTLVLELRGLGGAMPAATDGAMLQFRMLNRRKGPAVWGPRAQVDAALYARLQGRALARAGVEVVEDEVLALAGATERPGGVLCRRLGEVRADAVVLAAGTFLGGRLFRGDEVWRGGRSGDVASGALLEDLARRMFHVERFKTGTSPRVLSGSIDRERMEVQEEHGAFSFSADSGLPEEGMPCFRTRTSRSTSEAAMRHIGSSPLLGGRIEGTGPRYCPSFEDKVVRFPDRDSHPVYVEPMGRRSRLSYVSGLSTSLPRRAQEEMLRTVPGLERAVVSRYGYAVEYACMSGGELEATLRLAGTENVFAAGQVCGTSGYEEAAALGLLAGANAARCALGLDPVEPDRAESYLGVLVDDLCSGQATEPYRLFSARAENRLWLRPDNARRRMLSLAERLGTLTGRELDEARSMADEAERLRRAVEEVRIDGVPGVVLCRRPGTSTSELRRAESLRNAPEEALRSVMLDVRYAPYVSRARARVERMRRASGVSLRGVVSYMSIDSICTEARMVLERERPENMGQAARLPGVRPSDVSNLLAWLSGGGRST